MSSAEPRNPFYALLLVSCLLFVITALAVALVPALEQHARDAGAEVPPSPFRDMLRSDGWRILIFEVAGILLFGACGMGLDRLRRLKKERQQAGISQTEDKSAGA